MTTITIRIPEDRLAVLTARAEQMGLTPEELAGVALEDWLAQSRRDFVDAAEYVLRKNADLYQRDSFMPDEIVTLPAPELPPAPPLSKFDRERWAFYRLLGELLKSHRGKYVAIHEEQVVDSDENKTALIQRVLARVGNVDLYVALVSDEPPRPIRIPHYRVIREW